MSKARMDYERCQPEHCPGGICLARGTCPVKAISQDEPYAVPFFAQDRCRGCSKCAEACPFGAFNRDRNLT